MSLKNRFTCKLTNSCLELQLKCFLWMYDTFEEKKSVNKTLERRGDEH